MTGADTRGDARTTGYVVVVGIRADVYADRWRNPVAHSGAFTLGELRALAVGTTPAHAELRRFLAQVDDTIEGRPQFAPDAAPRGLTP